MLRAHCRACNWRESPSPFPSCALSPPDPDPDNGRGRLIEQRRLLQTQRGRNICTHSAPGWAPAATASAHSGSTRSAPTAAVARGRRMEMNGRPTHPRRYAQEDYLPKYAKPLSRLCPRFFVYGSVCVCGARLFMMTSLALPSSTC
jgi:hypothetical protein